MIGTYINMKDIICIHIYIHTYRYIERVRERVSKSDKITHHTTMGCEHQLVVISLIA